MSTLLQAGQTGALDNINSSQGQFRAQIALLLSKVFALETEVNQLKQRVTTLEQS